MKAEKILFRDENRIKIDIPYSRESISVIQQIQGAKWSQTIHAWHIPYTREAFRHLKSMFPEVVYDKKKPETQAGQTIITPMAGLAGKDVTIHVTQKRIIVKLPLLKPYSSVFHLNNLSNFGLHPNPNLSNLKLNYL